MTFKLLDFYLFYVKSLMTYRRYLREDGRGTAFYSEFFDATYDARAAIRDCRSLQRKIKFIRDLFAFSALLYAVITIYKSRG